MAEKQQYPELHQNIPSPPTAESPAPSPDKVTDVKNADAALDFLRHEHDVRPMTPEDETRLLRKIDFRIMPLMFGCYCLQYLDKTLINYAAVMGLKSDANMTGNQFSTLALIFYVSYLGVEFPHGYGMQRLPTAKYLGTMVTLWGLIVAVTSACKNYGALVATRVLLGVFESAVAPSLILITSMWYKRHEQPPRVGVWYTGVGFGTIFGSLISFGFQHYHGATFFSWQIMFLVVGLVTMIVGISVVLFLPDNPMKSRLSHDEKVWAVERLRDNQTGIENEHAQIIQGIGFTSKETALLQIPSGTISVIGTVLASWIAGRYNMRGFQVIALLIPGIIGGALMAYLPDDKKIGKLMGNYLTNCIGSSLPLLYSWVSANYAGHTKKVTMNATLLIAFCIGNILGPLSFRDNDAPEYIPAKLTIVVVCAAAVVLTVVLQLYYLWENKRRDKLAREGRVHHKEDIEFSDSTDRQNLEFRYRL